MSGTEGTIGSGQEMIILGVDPGLQHTGLGVITLQGQAMRWRDSVILRTDAAETMPARLRTLFLAMQQALREWKPHVVVVEKLINARNAQVALKLGQARGVLLLAAAEEKLPIAEYTPTEVKRAVTANGAASKEQVHRMVKALMEVPQLTPPYDVTDALALAICHAHRTSCASRLSTEGLLRTSSMAHA